jgi:protein-disulfide isomerase
MTKANPLSNTAKPVRGNVLTREARILAGIALVFTLFAVALVLVRPPTQTAASVDPNVLVRANSPSLGPADAPVTIVEFLDPECESCRAAFPVVKELLERYDGQVRLVVRYFPLHNNSVLAASATEAAGEQGKYWEMQELLFERQPEWGEQSTPQTARIIQYASELGLDSDQFLAALENPAYREKVERDQADGTALGVTGTPTFFINGRPLETLSYEGLVAAIEAELR